MASEEETVPPLQDKWRDECARYLSTQFTTVSLSDLAVIVKRPADLPPQVNLGTLLQEDPLQRFAISGEGNTMRARRIFRVDDVEIREYVEEWRHSLSEYLSMQSSTVGLSDIGSNVSRPSKLPTSVKLIDVLKSDDQNRFIVTGEGNNIKAKFNFHLSEDQVAALVEQWRESISRFLSTQSTTVGLSDIGSHVQRPFCLPNSIKLLDTLQNDPHGRFAISGEGSAMRARRIFRVDDKEIVKFVDEWRRTIARYLATQYTTVSLSDIGSNVSRPGRLPTSVKLIEVMRSDSMNRFVLSGDGNNIRAALSTFARSQMMGMSPEPQFGIGFGGSGISRGRESPRSGDWTMSNSGNSSPGRFKGSALMSGNQIGVPPLATGVGLTLPSPLAASGANGGSMSPRNYPRGQYLSSPAPLQQGAMQSPSLQQSMGGSQVHFPSPMSTPSSLGQQNRARPGFQSSNFPSPYPEGDRWPPASPSYSNGVPQAVSSESLGLPLGTPKNGGLGIDTSDMALGIGGSNPASRRAVGSSVGGSMFGFSPSPGESNLGFGMSPVSTPMLGQLSPRVQPSDVNLGFGGGMGMAGSPSDSTQGVFSLGGVPKAASLEMAMSSPRNNMGLGIGTPSGSNRFGSNEVGTFAQEDVTVQSMPPSSMHQGLGVLENGMDSMSLSHESGSLGMGIPPPPDMAALSPQAFSPRAFSPRAFSPRPSYSASPHHSPGKMSIPEEFMCPITHTIMTDPVLCSDGITYERSAIEEWLMMSSRSPILGTELMSAVLVPDMTLKAALLNHQSHALSSRNTMFAFDESPPAREPMTPMTMSSLDELVHNDLPLPRKERIASDSDPVLPLGYESPRSKSPVKCPKLWETDWTNNGQPESSTSALPVNKLPSPINTGRSNLSLLETDHFDSQGDLPSFLPAFSPVGIFGERTKLSPSCGSPFGSVGSRKAVTNSYESNLSTGVTDTEGRTSPPCSPPHDALSNGSSLSDPTEEANVLLSQWLPEVFAGFDSTLVQGFIEKLRDEAGFANTKDLFEAQVKGQLTFELLKDLADFKLGHYNRLVAALSSLSSKVF